MSRADTRSISVDWFTVLLYLLLVIVGLVAIYSAGFESMQDSSIFSMDTLLKTRFGKQVIWAMLSFLIIIFIQFIDRKIFQQLSPLFFGITIVLLLYVMFFGRVIAGAQSWIDLGFFRLQPSEFAKITTALLLAAYAAQRTVNLENVKDLLIAAVIFLIPMGLIVAQGDAGTAMVYGGLVVVLYREGLPGIILILAFSAVVLALLTFYFGKLPVGLFLSAFTISVTVLHLTYKLITQASDKKFSLSNHFIVLALSIPVLLLSIFYFRLNLEAMPSISEATFGQLSIVLLGLGTILMLAGFFVSKKSGFLILFALWTCVSFSHVGQYAFDNVLKTHHRNRINDYLGKVQDPAGIGYNRTQALLAIGSGGVSGKGFLNGVRIRGNYVPEEDTDFIFCVVGEEFGFIGTGLVILLFLLLLLRLLSLAERSPTTFARVYIYCVTALIFGHLCINVGMNIGLVPVIGIPLPFLSYGGSSLMAFSILVFIGIKLDSERFKTFR